MKKLLFLLLLCIPLISPPIVAAFSIQSDPQYIIINVADFYFTDWDADEATWQNEVKPEVIAKLNEIETTLGRGTDQRQLAWSTLLEYTDFPMDEPSPESRYVIQARRIMEVAEEVDLPVFMPLNGYQWWNEVPELWNHWDHDGNQTPGCENDNYDDIIAYSGEEPIYSCKFPKLREPEYRQRFIEGYNPDNQWNVEWQDWETPMHLNWRNWGAGGFQLAPPPNLAQHSRTSQSYASFQKSRYDVIISQISQTTQRWEEENKSYLFAGFSIGTEVSLNASVTPADEFEPYGYRAIQDTICDDGQPTCGSTQQISPDALHELRQKVVGRYLEQLSRAATKQGIPKQRIYTHVWSEASPGEARYTNYFDAAINFYSRPTLSLYGHAQDPLAFPLLRTTLQEHSYPVWGAAEFSTDKDAASWQRAMRNTLSDTTSPAQIINIYNWREHVGTAAIQQIKSALDAPVTYRHPVSEVESIPSQLTDPTQLTWKVLSPNDEATHQYFVLFDHQIPLQYPPEPLEGKVFEISPDETSMAIESLKPGRYYWQVERATTKNNRTFKTQSLPQVFVISFPEQEKPPSWVSWFLNLEDKFVK